MLAVGHDLGYSLHKASSRFMIVRHTFERAASSIGTSSCPLYPYAAADEKNGLDRGGVHAIEKKKKKE